MADSKISNLTELTTPASADELVVVDKSDTTMAASGTDKRITHGTLIGVANRTLLFSAESLVLHDQTALGIALLNGGYATSNPAFVTSGAAPSAVGSGLPILRYVAGDHDRTGLLTNFLLRAQVSVNATAGGITFTFGVYPVTVAGGTDTLQFTLGTVVTGTTTGAISSTASTINQGVSTAQDMTGVTGTYCIGVVPSGTLANNSSVQLSAQLWRLYTYA